MQRPSYARGFTNPLTSASPPPEQRTPTAQTAAIPHIPKALHVKRVTLTSKKNWWMVEMNEEEEVQPPHSVNSFSSSEETAVDSVVQYNHGLDEQMDLNQTNTPPPSPLYYPPRHPTSIFSFPTPTAYCAPPNPTASLTPFAHGSASELFKCVVKKT